MAKVIRAFRDRTQNLKRYDVGDEYPESDKERVAYLVREGFLAPPEPPVEKPKKRKKGADADGDSDG